MPQYELWYLSAMPLTEKGTKILAKMRKTYGAKKAKQVFHAMINEGKLTGVEAQPAKNKKGKKK